jgi:hypothetical protein
LAVGATSQAVYSTGVVANITRVALADIAAVAVVVADLAGTVVLKGSGGAHAPAHYRVVDVGRRAGQSADAPRVGESWGALGAGGGAGRAVEAVRYPRVTALVHADCPFEVVASEAVGAGDCVGAGPAIGQHCGAEGADQIVAFQVVANRAGVADHRTGALSAGLTFGNGLAAGAADGRNGSAGVDLSGRTLEHAVVAVDQVEPSVAGRAGCGGGAHRAVGHRTRQLARSLVGREGVVGGADRAG